MSFESKCLICTETKKPTTVKSEKSTLDRSPQTARLGSGGPRQKKKLKLILILQDLEL